MRDVTEACLLPDLKKLDPRQYLQNHGWVESEKTGAFEKQIGSASYSVRVEWPASEKSAAGCSFESDQVTSADVYDWFRKRIGEPQDIRWDVKQIGGWRINTNSRDVGVYISRKNPNVTERAGMMLHILQP